MAAGRPTPARALGWRGPTALLVAAACYLYGLGAIDLPSIGDEPLYLQIARVTAESGRPLPLRAESGVLDTKPPLLFWMGAAAAGGPGDGWTLFRLRLPVVLLTFAAAAVAGLLAARLGGEPSRGWLAALLLLGFRGTIQHGRPFLTNAGEVLFLALPLLLVVGRRPRAVVLGLGAGLSFGAAALFKSFAVVVPGAVALGLLLARREGSPRLALRRHGLALAGAAALGLALFALWPLLDPRPDLVLAQFVVGENGGKLAPSRFLSGLFAGPYPLWRVWLGPLLNAGLLAPPLLALAADAWRRRRAGELPAAEAELWWWVAGFLLVYSLPTQRQENYVLPAGVALAALLATRWAALPGWASRLPLALLGLAAAALPVALHLLARAGGAAHPAWLPAASAGFAAAALAGAVRGALGRRLLPALAVLALALVTGLLEPFAAPFPAAAAAEVAGRDVFAPDRFAQDQELLRFRLPGARLGRYPCPTGTAPCAPPAATSTHALAFLEPGAPPPPGYEVAAELPHLKARQEPDEVARIAAGDLGPLLERLALLRPVAAAAAPRPAEAAPPAVPDPSCPAGLAFPDPDWRAAPAGGPARAAAVGALDGYAFARSGPDAERRGLRTDGLLVLRRGELLHERYAGGYGPATPHAAWSVAKAATGALAGVAVRRGALSLDDSICRHRPAAAGRCPITVRHLLESASGLDWSEGYEGSALQASSVLAMLYGEGRRDMAAFVLGHAQRFPAGERFAYSSGDSLLLAAVVDAALSPSLAPDAPRAALFGPLGMASAVLERDRAGTPVGSSFLHATPRDLARLGQLFLADGCWKGVRLLPAGWMAASTAVGDAMRAAAPGREPGDVYGRGLWLNRPVPALGQGLPWPGAPGDAYAARGHWGQVVAVVPSAGLVVVRTGDDREEGALDLGRLLALAAAVGSAE